MPTRFAHAQSKYGDRSFTLGDAARTAVGITASVPVLPFVALGYGLKTGAKYGKKGANMAAKGLGNITGLRTRSGLTRKQKAAATATATAMNSRGGRKLKKSNKRKSVKKSKGKKTTTRKRGKK